MNSWSFCESVVELKSVESEGAVVGREWVDADKLKLIKEAGEGVMVEASLGLALTPPDPLNR